MFLHVTVCVVPQNYQLLIVRFTRMRFSNFILPGLMMILQKVMNTPKLSPEGRIFDGTPNYEFLETDELGVF